jgi:hypothetical protein
LKIVISKKVKVGKRKQKSQQNAGFGGRSSLSRASTYVWIEALVGVDGAEGEI